jgi:hypothetical protein
MNWKQDSMVSLSSMKTPAGQGKALKGHAGILAVEGIAGMNANIRPVCQ